MHIAAAREVKARLWEDVGAWRAAQPAPAEPTTLAIGIRPLGDGSYGVAVRTSGDTPLARTIAERGQALAGAECDVREVGTVRPLQWEPGELQSRVRPLRPGLSVAHLRVTAGTIGAFVVPADGAGPVAVLSNNHVLADSGRGAAGEVVLQPGPADGGREPDDRIGTLDRVASLRLDGSNWSTLPPRCSTPRSSSTRRIRRAG